MVTLASVIIKGSQVLGAWSQVVTVSVDQFAVDFVIFPVLRIL